MIKQIYNWFRLRLSERSTQVAIVGLLPILFKYINIPNDVIEPMVNLIIALLGVAIVTKG